MAIVLPAPAVAVVENEYDAFSAAGEVRKAHL